MTPPEALKQQAPLMTPDRATAALQAEFVHYVFDKNKADKTLSANDLHASSQFNPSGSDSVWAEQARALLRNLNSDQNKNSSTDAMLERSMLGRLLSQPPDERAVTLKQFRENDDIQSQMQRSKDVIRDQVSHGSMRGGIQEQMKLVDLSEKLNTKPLNLELSCLNDAIKETKGTPSQELLDRQKYVEQLLAAPFMERVRLGLFELKNDQTYDAENMFKQAIGVDISGAVSSKEIMELRQAVAEKAHALEIERELPDLFRKNFSSLAANSSKREIMRDDLARAANSNKVDPVLVDFLLRNYKMLNSMSHGLFDWSDGITQAGVDAYQVKYGRKIFP